MTYGHYDLHGLLGNELTPMHPGIPNLYISNGKSLLFHYVQIDANAFLRFLIEIWKQLCEIRRGGRDDKLQVLKFMIFKKKPKRSNGQIFDELHC